MRVAGADVPGDLRCTGAMRSLSEYCSQITGIVDQTQAERTRARRMVGVGVIRAQSADLFQAAQTAQASADRFAELLARVDQAVRELRAEWTGSASDGFQAAVVRWEKASDDLHEALGQLGVLLSTAESNYTAAEDANLTTWRPI
jgi:WXG100 family type VII secretion target